MFAKSSVSLYIFLILLILLTIPLPTSAKSLETDYSDSKTIPAISVAENFDRVSAAAMDTSESDVSTQITSDLSRRISVRTVSEKEGVLPLNDGSGNRTPDWNGIWLDTGLFVGAQFVACGIIYTMPERFSSWSAEQKQDIFNNYADNFMHPVFDKDAYSINYILHPYWGATYYTRGRERGLDAPSSFLFSFAMSALFEFGAECFVEKPSIQDIIVTPGLGSLLGALVFEPLRNHVKGKEELHWYDHVALVATDPLGLLSVGVEKMFGVKSTILVDYSTPKYQARSNPGGVIAAQGSKIGLTMQVTFN